MHYIYLNFTLLIDIKIITSFYSTTNNAAVNSLTHVSFKH